MAHVDYEMWADFILELFIHKKGREPENILDAACGTGEIMLNLLKKGYRVKGFDISHEMVSAGRKKISSAGFDPRLISVEDMRMFFAEDKPDLIMCNFDSVNYLKDSNALTAFFSRVRSALSSGGLFIFDAATEYLCENYYHKAAEREKIGEVEIQRESVWDSIRKILTTDFVFSFNSGGGNEQIFEKHEQKIFNREEIFSSLYDAGFLNAEIFADFGFDELTEQSLRLHFAAEK
jgi:ubiquinone/menaquinone biosynthesis C-methylase UbiE